MSRRSAASGTDMGHDAFLDIVANLVGILIILVVVLGSQSTGILGVENAETAPEIASDAELDSLAQASLRAKQAKSDSVRLEQRIKQYDMDLAAKRKQRGALMDLLAIVSEAWEEQKASLDQQKVATAELDARRRDAEKQLSDLALEQSSIDRLEENTVEVEHLPTPMAKAVFSEEIHLRLKDGKLSIVPLNELIEEMKRQIKGGMSANRRTGQSLDAVGPVRGYVARYVTDHQRGVLEIRGQRTLGVQTSLVSAVIEPLQADSGQPMTDVLRGQSELEVELAGRAPNRTTITAWVYPDSFGQFAALKRYLYRRGFATAARPLEADMPIGVSPRGSRSVAQ